MLRVYKKKEKNGNFTQIHQTTIKLIQHQAIEI